MSGYDVYIRRNADGLVRVCHINLKWDPVYRNTWSTGICTCDCNRQLLFHRAAKEPVLDRVPCGKGLYAALKFVLPDGTEIGGADDGR